MTTMARRPPPRNGDNRSQRRAVEATAQRRRRATAPTAMTPQPPPPQQAQAEPAAPATRTVIVEHRIGFESLASVGTAPPPLIPDGSADAADVVIASTSARRRNAGES